ncbi:MAG: hypothetical protein V1676_02165 [Candidatus Diapherotrites archaeon]
MNMHKQAIAIILVGFVFLFGCPQQVPSGGAAVMYVCADGSTVSDKAQCPMTAGAAPARQLTTDEELGVCSGMPVLQQGSFEDFCIIGVSAKHKDGSLCRKVSQDRRTMCYALVAEAKGDPNACADAEFLKEQCYQTYASDKKESSVCGKIADVSAKDSCYSSLANQLKDAALCDKMSDIAQRDSCYSSFSYQSSDPALCDKIQTSYQKDSCYLNMAQRLRNSSYCEKITDGVQKQNCLQNIGSGSGAYEKIAMPVPSK